MRESIGSVFLYNMIILFIVIVFAFLAGTISYYKAFKVNSNIAKALEIYEGYNSYSDTEIVRVLTTLGYHKGDTKCPQKKGTTPVAITGTSSAFDYCLYFTTEDNRHYTYGITTFIRLDLPVIGERLRLPIYSKTERIFRFTNT